MKKNIVLILTLFVITGICFAADPVEGFWISFDEKTGKATAGWQIYVEGGKLYGKMLSFSNKSGGFIATHCKDSYPNFPVAGIVNQMPYLETPWIYGLSSTKIGEWSGGSIVNPEDGRHYKCKITYRPADGRKYQIDTLEMRGEIGLGIGRSQFWQKSDQQAASSL